VSLTVLSVAKSIGGTALSEGNGLCNVIASYAACAYRKGNGCTVY